ncbi:MAG TPA: KOW motif-containing protein [Candidatus Baltobacteraceae bacterium]|nr:KOW motif-containing protein [Candidatus Baltobacteraceae bacterium]
MNAVPQIVFVNDEVRVVRGIFTGCEGRVDYVDRRELRVLVDVELNKPFRLLRSRTVRRIRVPQHELELAATRSTSGGPS